LLQEIAEAAQLAAESERCAARVDSVSHWSVQQQLDHLLHTDTALLQGLRKGLAGEARETRGGPSPMGWFVLLTGFIPRGKGKAPEFVLPTDRSSEEIAAGLEETLHGFEALADSLEQIERSPGRIPHPILGRFNSVQWLRFAVLHHWHHNKIIADILRSQGRDETAR